MAKFDVYLTRLVTEYALVTVEADDEEGAAEAALHTADGGDWQTQDNGWVSREDVSAVWRHADSAPETNED